MKSHHLGDSPTQSSYLGLSLKHRILLLHFNMEIKPNIDGDHEQPDIETFNILLQFYLRNNYSFFLVSTFNDSLLVSGFHHPLGVDPTPTKHHHQSSSQHHHHRQYYPHNPHQTSQFYPSIYSRHVPASYQYLLPHPHQYKYSKLDPYYLPHDYYGYF